MSQSGSVSGGPVDHVFTRLRDRIADVSAERLRMKHVGVDDDNLWFTRWGNDAAAEIQIGTTAGGEPPFLIEGMTENQRLLTSDIAAAAATIESWLRP